MRLTKAEKLPYPRFTKLIITRIMSNNTTINQRSDLELHSASKDRKFKTVKVIKQRVMQYGLQIPDTMLNKTIKKMDAYKEFVVKCKRLVVPMDQLQPVVPTQGTHKKTRTKKVRKISGKGPMMRGKEVAEHVESFKTNIVLRSKKKPTEKSKKVNEIANSERLRLAKEEIDDDVDDTLKAIKNLKLKGISKINDVPQRTPDAQLLLYLKEGHKLSRRERWIQDLSRGPKEGSVVMNETHDEKDSLDSDQTPSALKDVGLLRPIGTSGLNFHDRTSRKEEPSGDSVDIDRLIESQMVNVPEVTITEPTGPDQHGFTVVNPEMHLTLGKTLTFGLVPRGNPELTSCTSGASEIPSDALAQNLNL
nr:hypothetical protein [Tanacetum cinerariifolium]